MLAVTLNNFGAVKILAKIGSVNWNKKNRDKETAFTLALKRRNKELAQIILSNVPNLDFDVKHLKSQAVYQEAVTACQQYVIKNGDEYNGDDEAIMFALKEGCIMYLFLAFFFKTN